MVENVENKFPLLAIDGGGTKTIAVIVDSSGNIISKAKTEGSNYHVVGEERTFHSLYTVIQETINCLRSDKIDNINKFHCAVFALAGLDTEKDQLLVEGTVMKVIETLKLNIDKVIVENDGYATLLGATKNLPGALLISGTGSISFAHDGNGKIVRAGGWGYQVGDEGSGYWIGKEAIRSVFRMFDGREKQTILAEKILHSLQFSDIEQLYNWVYKETDSVDQVSRLAQVVEKACQEGDPVSKKILDQAVTELYDLLHTVLLRSNIIEGPFTLVLQGGVLKNIGYIRERLINRIGEKIPQAGIFLSQVDPIDLIIERGLLALNQK